jgi:hypothetical protein
MFLFLLFPKNTSKTMANKQKWDEKKKENERLETMNQKIDVKIKF